MVQKWLQNDRSSEVFLHDMDKRKQEEFKKIWRETADWIGSLILDAVAFASTNENLPLSRNYLGLETTDQFRRSEIATKFKSSVWPSLQSRGWKSRSGNGESSIEDLRYNFGGVEVW